MKANKQIFHLSVPCRDIEETAAFYEEKLGCRVARRYEDRVTFDFFGHQVVFQLSPDKIDAEPSMYPRHFGITFADKAAFDQILESTRRHEVPFFEEPFVRFEGKREEHWTFFLQDPSNNLIEFKWYMDPEMRY